MGTSQWRGKEQEEREDLTEQQYRVVNTFTFGPRFCGRSAGPFRQHPATTLGNPRIAGLLSLNTRAHNLGQKPLLSDDPGSRGKESMIFFS